MRKKGISSIVSLSLLLIVAIISIVSFQTWFVDLNSEFISDIDVKNNEDTIEIKDSLGANIYLDSNKGFNIAEVKFNGVSCNISGYYSSGIQELNITSCFSQSGLKSGEIFILTEDGQTVSKSLIIDDVVIPTVGGPYLDCFDSANVGLVGDGGVCNGMLIVNRTMLDYAISNNPINSGEDFFLEYNGINYTFGDSTYNVFTGQVISMASLFFGQTNFNASINYWNTSNVILMGLMFFNNFDFNQPIDSWDVSSVTNMDSMFTRANSFNQPIDSWDVSSVTSMNNMFYLATDFNQPLNSWDVSSVIDMGSMFRSTTSFNQDLNNWTTSNVTNMDSMFRSSSSFNGNISTWNVSSVTDMELMFSGATDFNQPLNSWDVSSVVTTGGMFSGASSFNHDLSSWVTSSVTSMTLVTGAGMFATYDGMFEGASSFDQNISLWDVDQVTSCTEFDESTSVGWIASEKPNFTSC